MDEILLKVFQQAIMEAAAKQLNWLACGSYKGDWQADVARGRKVLDAVEAACSVLVPLGFSGKELCGKENGR